MENLRALLLIVATNNHADTEWANTSRLRVLLKQVSNLLAQHEWRDSVAISGVVHLDVFASLEEDRLEVRTDSTVANTHVLTQVVHLVDGGLIH